MVIIVVVVNISKDKRYTRNRIPLYINAERKEGKSTNN